MRVRVTSVFGMDSMIDRRSRHCPRASLISVKGTRWLELL